MHVNKNVFHAPPTDGYPRGPRQKRSTATAATSKGGGGKGEENRVHEEEERKGKRSIWDYF